MVFWEVFSQVLDPVSHTYQGVVVKGVMTSPFKGESNRSKMVPGSYWHATAGVSETPYGLYFHSD